MEDIKLKSIKRNIKVTNNTAHTMIKSMVAGVESKIYCFTSGCISIYRLTADSQTQDTTEHTDSGQASVQEVTPDQSATATTQQAADVQQAADAQQTEAAQTDVAKTIAVKIQKSDVDGGTVKVVNADGSKSDVTYDGNNQYAKEVTEGESFGFEVTAKDGYQVEQVTDQNGTAIQPASVNGNVSTYNVTDIRSERVFSVTYNKVETQTEEKKDEKTENKAEDATATEETEDQNDADTQVTSNARDIHVDTETEKWITVGKTVTLSNEYKSSAWTTYTHSWKIKKGNDVVSINVSNSNSISVKGKKAGEATITDTITWNSFFEGQQKKTITYTIHVSEAVAPTAITINGADSVTQFKDINLTYTLTPAGAEGTVQWSSSNEDILTVDSSGRVTGLRRGQATVTANVYSGQSLLCSATKTIQVVEDTTVAGDSAIVYYLLDPTKDANSNDSGNWGPAYGTAKVNVTGATWTGGRNCFDNVDQRVVSWPNGTNVVTRDSTAWNQIFNKYKSSVEEQLGVPITEDDVVSITLRPAKISRNNSSTPDLHLDCNVDVNCKRVSIVHYYLLDKSSDPNSTEYVHQGSKSYINGNKTNPETVTGKSFPTTKTGTDGATYTFSGWYTDQELTQPATFPYTVNSNVNFYAKYVAGRQVVYNLDGGSFSDGSSLTEKHNEGENVVVKSEPTRKGYKFTGWTVEGLDGVSSINSGASFQMPNNNVTITANWEEQKIEDFITLTPTDVTEVYNGEAHAAGIATASAKKAEANLDGVKIEYQKADGTWTENPAEITATNVADSTTVKVRVTSENYTGKLEDTEKLTITKRPIEITGSGWTSSQPYTGKAYTKTDYEVEQANVENTRGLVAGETATVSYEITGTNVGPYTGTFGDDLEIKTAGGILGIGAKNVTDNYTVTKTPGTLTISKAEINQYVTLNPRDVEEVYDGTAHEAGVATATDSNGNELKIEYSVDGTNWTTDPGTITATEVKDSVTVNVRVSSEGNYDGYVTGTEKLTITKRPITITGSGWDTDQVYTGKEYKKTEYTVEETNAENTRGLVSDEEATISYEIKGTNVNDYTGTFEDNFLVKKGNKDVTSNYEPVKEEGTLKIVAQSITPGTDPENPDPSYDGIQIDSPSDVEYDGQAHKWSPTVTDKNGNALTESTDYEVSYDKDDFTDVKTITVTITGKGNYTGTVTRVYNILAAPLIIRTEKAEKTYDGKPLTNENMTIEGLKNGEVVVHKTTGSQTEVGNSDNTYELDWKSKETTAKESNYIIKEVSLGKLVVKETEDEIVVTTTGGTFTYDGQPHGATVEVSELPEGYTLQTAESDATATDVTTEAVTADADRLVIVNAAGVDVTANLKITRVTGEIVVNPATVTVTTPNASKVYDGTPLTAAGTITGLVNGETVSFATTGTITNVGTATNSYSLVWDQTAKETNYTVSENLGTLTVTAPTNNNPSVTPTPPATPNPPATPSDNPGVLDRVVDTIKDVAADVQEVFSSDDGDVPLANQNLDEHKCCILHFLIMLLTAILYGFFTHNMKKRQKKNFELREELDTELVKRGLPTSKEQKNS